MNPSTQDFSKRIPAYLDGMMNDSERVDFESYIATNPDFARLFRQKQIEQESIARRVPEVKMEEGTLQQLEAEAKEVINNLFVDEEAAPAKRLKTWFLELF